MSTEYLPARIAIQVAGSAQYAETDNGGDRYDDGRADVSYLNWDRDFTFDFLVFNFF